MAKYVGDSGSANDPVGTPRQERSSTDPNAGLTASDMRILRDGRNALVDVTSSTKHIIDETTGQVLSGGSAYLRVSEEARRMSQEKTYTKCNVTQTIS